MTQALEPATELVAGSNAQLEHLTRLSSADMLKALGLAGLPLLRPALEWLCQPAARRLALQVQHYDLLVASIGLQPAGAWALGQFVREVAISGQHWLPRTGPLLIVANHPGLYDTLALFAAIPRADLQIVAAERPFLAALPNTARRLIVVSDDASARIANVRKQARHLQAGGALLTFPGGRIEPDPAVLPGADTALQHWSNSLAVCARLVPELQIVPALVSGVLSVAALEHPLLLLRHTPEQRQLLAATLQLLFPALQQGTLRVRFGPAIRPQGDQEFAFAAVLEAEQRLIAECRREAEG